jgi:hypothetical protein
LSFADGKIYSGGSPLTHLCTACKNRVKITTRHVLKSSTSKYPAIIKSLQMKLSGKSYILPLYIYNAKDHAVHYSVILHGKGKVLPRTRHEGPEGE